MAKNPDLQKHTLNLHAGDYEKLQTLYPEVGAGPVIRQVIHDFIARIEAAEVKPAAPTIEL